MKQKKKKANVRLESRNLVLFIESINYIEMVLFYLSCSPTLFKFFQGFKCRLNVEGL